MPLLTWLSGSKSPSSSAYVAVVNQQNTPNGRNLRKFMNEIGKGRNSEFTSEMEILEDRQHRFIVVRRAKGAAVVAYALVRLDGASAELEQIYAAKKGEGFGHLALQAAEALAKDSGAGVMHLSAVPSAATFYIKEGYVTGDGQHFTKLLKSKANSRH